MFYLPSVMATCPHYCSSYIIRDPFLIFIFFTMADVFVFFLVVVCWYSNNLAHQASCSNGLFPFLSVLKGSLNYDFTVIWAGDSSKIIWGPYLIEEKQPIKAGRTECSMEQRYFALVLWFLLTNWDNLRIIYACVATWISIWKQGVARQRQGSTHWTRTAAQRRIVVSTHVKCRTVTPTGCGALPHSIHFPRWGEPWKNNIHAEREAAVTGRRAVARRDKLWR